MLTETGKVRYPFLEGGGEMGELTRVYDWSSTPVGPVDQWPQTLKAMVGVILHSEFPMFMWWGDEMIQFYNDAYRPSLGENGKHPAALGQRAVECWGEIWDVIYPLITRVRTTNKSFFLEDQLIPIYRNGRLEEVYWTFSYSSVIGETGNIDGVLVVCNETTSKVNMVRELELARKTLLTRESNLLSVLRQAPVAMCIMLGPQHIVHVANDLIIDLWGKPADTVLNKPILEILPEVSDQGLIPIMDQVYQTGCSYRTIARPVTLVRKGKEEIIYQDFVYEPYRAADGTILGVLAISIDVTEQVLARQKIEEVVAERTRDLQKSNNELSQFAYIASHDLQEPARKISTFIGMVNKSLAGNVDPRTKSYLEKIETSAARMLVLIRDVLAISQLSKGAYQLEDVNLGKVLSEVWNEFELVIEQKQATLESDTLPVVHAIPVQMSQLFGNLISNALKFTREGVPARIRITAEKLTRQEVSRDPELRDAHVYHRISITDNGIGFSQVNASQIFDIFQRLHSRSEYEGTGIGLAMCRKIVENHGGRIYASGEPGAGATFTVILPSRRD